MSIKSQGGVFGRNPTFNDVTVEGDLSIDGTLSVGGNVLSGLDFEGAWDATSGAPSATPSTGQFWIVSVAGTTDLSGITNWGIGDWALYDGSAWQRIEGGADGNFKQLTSSSTTVLNGTTIPASKTLVVTTDIGSTVEAYDATILKSADIGSTVQGYDADTAKYDDATANFTGTLQNGGSNVVVDSDIGSTVQAYDATILKSADIGSTVQGYDADTAKLDVAQTWTETQNFATTTATATGYGTASPSSPVDIFTTTAGNANYEAIEMTNYDYGAGETGQSISIISKVRNDGGGLSPTAALYFIKESDYSSAANRDGGLAIYTNRSNSFVEAARFTSEGNLKFATSGSGIDFSATSGTGTSELLDDYEEGTWTPTILAGSLTINATSCHYTKIGNVVTVFFNVTFPVQTNANDADLFSLPFTISSTGGSAAAISTDRSTTDPTFGLGFANQARLRFFSGSAVLTLTGMSGKNVSGSFTYRV